ESEMEPEPVSTPGGQPCTSYSILRVRYNSLCEKIKEKKCSQDEERKAKTSCLVNNVQQHGYNRYKTVDHPFRQSLDNESQVQFPNHNPRYAIKRRT
ncbi:hypothetical protein BGZ76_007016, partial [Entomortierella beljakovae]